MDLRLANRTVWIVSPALDVSRELARAALEEGARAAIFSVAAECAVRPLRFRFGLQVLACAPSTAAGFLGRPTQAASQWGGPPAGVIIHVPGSSPLAAYHADVQAFCDPAPADGAILILRESSDPDADEAELTRAFEGDLDVARTFAGGRTRVSMIGCMSGNLDGDATASRLAHPACAALAIFLIGRGGPQLALIGRDGDCLVGRE